MRWILLCWGAIWVAWFAEKGYIPEALILMCVIIAVVGFMSIFVRWGSSPSTENKDNSEDDIEEIDDELGDA